MTTTDLPQFDLYWFGEPCQYDEDDKVLKSFPAGDLGGRYLALPIGRSPQVLFDETMAPLKGLYGNAKKRQLMTQQLSPEVVLIDGIRMSWIFASQEIARLRVENRALQTRIEKLEALVASGDEPS